MVELSLTRMRTIVQRLRWEGLNVDAITNYGADLFSFFDNHLASHDLEQVCYTNFHDVLSKISAFFQENDYLAILFTCRIDGMGFLVNISRSSNDMRCHIMFLNWESTTSCLTNSVILLLSNVAPLHKCTVLGHFAITQGREPCILIVRRSNRHTLYEIARNKIRFRRLLRPA